MTETLSDMPVRPSGVDRAARERHPTNVFTAAAWSEFLYLILGFGTSVLFFALTVTLLAVGTGLAVIYVGVPLAVLGLLFARAGGLCTAGLARVLLDWPVAPPQPIRPRRPGPVGWALAVLRDSGCWRAVAFHLIRIMLAPLAFAASLGCYAYGLGGVTYWFWQHWLPFDTAPDGSRHRGAQLWPGFFLDTGARMITLLGLGAIMLTMAPRVTRVFTNLDRALLSGLIAGR